MVARRSGTATFDEFMLLVREDQKADLLDGVIHMASPVNTEDADLVMWLSELLGMFVRQLKLGKVFSERVAYHLSDHWAPEPDIAFVSKNRLNIVERGFVDGPPDLAVEIVSPESVERDYEIKRRGYELAGVLEYWIIDPAEMTVLFLVRSGDQFVEAARDGHIFRSRAVPNFYLDVRWLWQRPLPETLPLLQAMLSAAK
jgi:Uma2 family endonuclease